MSLKPSECVVGQHVEVIKTRSSHSRRMGIGYRGVITHILPDRTDAVIVDNVESGMWASELKAIYIKPCNVELF